ncbi:unnamed protein product [Lactuca saligna]|uniref:Uncharacterized protein n=1 Tax=Lactuca saligna TaxID=75948 RepID=A0AA36A1X8_LACSI|nr:unnamed protein product [Lactuca saligna]
MVDQLKFVESHNIAGYLLDLPAAHKEFKSMIASLNNCSISHTLRSNPVIYKGIITKFWKNSSISKQGADGAGAVESLVKGTPVIISEQVIQEVLEFGDAPIFPVEYSADQVKGFLEKMCYEGTYPPTFKKLLSPFWRLLAHYFVICISGRKGGSDEISQTATSAIVTLATDWDYNFSRVVFKEIKKKPSREEEGPVFDVSQDDDDDDDNDVNDDDDDDDDYVNFCLFVTSKDPVNETLITPAET